jgi:hypothetical protein
MKAAKRTGTKKPCANLSPATKITTIPAVTRMRVAWTFDSFSGMDLEPEDHSRISAFPTPPK